MTHSHRGRSGWPRAQATRQIRKPTAGCSTLSVVSPSVLMRVAAFGAAAAEYDFQDVGHPDTEDCAEHPNTLTAVDLRRRRRGEAARYTVAAETGRPEAPVVRQPSQGGCCHDGLVTMTPAEAEAALMRARLQLYALPDLATQWLLNGVDTPALRELAGHPRRDYDGIRALWTTVRGELGIPEGVPPMDGRLTRSELQELIHDLDHLVSVWRPESGLDASVAELVSELWSGAEWRGWSCDRGSGCSGRSAHREVVRAGRRVQ